MSKQGGVSATESKSRSAGDQGTPLWKGDIWAVTWKKGLKHRIIRAKISQVERTASAKVLRWKLLRVSEEEQEGQCGWSREQWRGWGRGSHELDHRGSSDNCKNFGFFLQVRWKARGKFGAKAWHDLIFETIVFGSWLENRQLEGKRGREDANKEAKI